MATVDTLVTRYMMDNRDYVAGARQVDTATKGNVASMAGLSGAIGGATTVLTSFVALVGGATAALVSLGATSFKKAAEFDAMVKALEAIEGSAKGAGDAIKELREIASRPGLGLQEAIEGYSGLRRAGMTREMSMRTLSAAGNANALAGGGREELGRILRAITQIAMKPNLSGEELMQLNEGGVAASRIIGDAFGTFDGAELKKMGVDSKDALEALVKGMEGMPKAANSAKNSLENLGMAVDMALVGIGTGLMSTVVGPLENLGTAIGKIEENGGFVALGEALGTVAETTFPELFESADTLDEKLEQLAFTVADVAWGMGNLKMNLQDISTMYKEANPFSFLFDWISGGVTGGGLSPSQHRANEREAEEFALAESDRKARADGWSSREAREAAKNKKGSSTADVPDPTKDPMASTQIKYLMEIERNTDVTAKAMRAIIGGSTVGENAFSPVNINRLTGGGNSGDTVTKAVNLLRSAIIDEILKQSRTVGV